MKNFCAGWYLMYTMPKHEKKVYNRLTERKIDSFLPMTKKLRSWHDRRKLVEEPLFPSYVFIYLKDWQSYYGGMETEGSLYYVKTGREIARVSDSIVNSIRLLIDKGNEIEVSTTHFQAGQQLIIRQGPLTGLCCEMVQANGGRKFLVRVHLLQRNLLVVLPPEHLMLADNN